MLHEASGAAAQPAAQMLESMQARVSALNLDLGGLTIITEAATGAYACTAVIAALAGAGRVLALARDTARHGSAADAVSATLSLAACAGVGERITPVDRIDRDHLSSCDILTNSGHLRPITAEIIECLPPRAVIALMFEAWEFRGTDLDLAACTRHGVRVAAVNERHPDVAVFPFLGPLCVRLLADAGMSLPGRKVAVLCDNPFSAFVRNGLENAGAETEVYEDAADVPARPWDAVVVALLPGRRSLHRSELEKLAAVAPGALLAQFWGDIDRQAAAATGFAICPAVEPGPGHMGILLNALGPEPIVRLQTGGLRAAECVFRGDSLPRDGVAQLLVARSENAGLPSV